MDLSALSTEDLMALKGGDLSKVSTDGLMKLKQTIPDQPQGGTLEDIGRSAASGVARALPYAVDVPAAALATGVEKLTGSQGTAKQLFQQNMQNGINPQASKVLGQEYQPQTEAGTLAKGAGMVVGSLPIAGAAGITEGVLPALGTVGRAAGSGVVGTAGSQVGGKIGKAVGGDTGEAIGNVVGGLAGGFGGAKTPEGVAGAARAVDSAIVPNVAPELQPLAQRAQQMGIPLSLNQVAPGRIRNTLQKVSQAIPGSGVEPFEQAQHSAFNKAVASTLGEQADNLGPETINSFLDRASTDFNGIMGGKTVSVPEDNLSAITNIGKEAGQNLTGPVADIVKNRIAQLQEDISQGGTIAGDKLASFRTSLIKAIPRADSGAKGYLGDLVDEVNNLAQSAVGPEDAAKLAILRNQWRNYKTVEPLLEKSPDGNINPTSLMQRVAANPYIKASRIPTGQDPLVDLARIGKAFLKTPGGSDTYEKTILGGGTLATLGTAAANPAAAVGGVLASGAAMGANRLFQKGINQSQSLVSKAINKGIAPLGQAPNPKDIIRRKP